VTVTRLSESGELVAVALSGAMVSVPTIRRRRLGGASAAWRGQRYEPGGCHRGARLVDQQVNRIELAKIAVTPADVRALLGVLDALSDEVETLVSLTSEDRQPGWRRQYAEVLPTWFEGYLSLESEAARLLAYESEVVPGLLQPRNTQPKYFATRPTHSYPTKQREQQSCVALDKSGSSDPTRYTSTW
jgi:hypothetical protein